MADAKTILKQYLQRERDALLWKLDGLGERDARWPMTATGTNILGVIKHVASVEAGYFGEVFGRPFAEPLPWLDDEAEDNADMWATTEQNIAWVSDFYRRVWLHSDATIDALDLEAAGVVAWWPTERREVTLQQILVHMIDETARHAGHVDILRELIDGRVGKRADDGNLPGGDASWWANYVERLEQTATASEEQRVVSATRTIDAPIDVIFELIADPSQQPRWDGNDNLARADAGQRVQQVGNVFSMVLTGDRGAVRENHVVEFEEGRRIAWMPAEPGGQPIGHLWRWELRAEGDTRTVVTHSYDWTKLDDQKRFVRARATTAERLMASIDRLATVASGGSA
ncbi:mycothiol transferase [Leifsonia sp. Root112D2]|uniref:mycothiol transferase n=1 Tax=Leifsonia sp. Root112D2 TaxID=1736426 RepID=UPI000A7DF4FE|nr:DUF664 domain-containing protein [Leifsonia sp. Root112D2]